MPGPQTTATDANVVPPDHENTHKIPTETDQEERTCCHCRELQNRSEVGEDQQSKKATLLHVDEDDQSRDYFWDQAVKLLASGMLALTLLEVLSSISGEAVQCFTPENYTRDQAAFINSFCTQFTRRTDFFLFLLVAQAVLVFGPHFLWSSVFYGKFRYFTALARSLDRHRNSQTGEFDSKNLVTVRALMETFGSTHVIYISYIAKLFLQLLVAGVFIGVCATLFNEYDPAFDCPANDSLHFINITLPLDEQIICVLSSLNLLYAVWWANFVLLAGTVVMTLCGLVWIGLNHQTKLNWRQVAWFTLESGIQPSYYHPKSWKKRWYPQYFCMYRIRSNLDFLVLRLYRDDAGRAKVLREVLIAQLIKEHEQTLQERLSFLRARKADEDTCTELLDIVEKEKIRGEGKRICNCMKNSEKVEPDRCSCRFRRAQEDQNLGNTLENVLCNFLTNDNLKLKWVNAIDVSFGSSGLMMLIATMRDCDQVVSVNFDRHYLNDKDPFQKGSFLSEIFCYRTWSTIFSKTEEEINELRDKIAEHFFDKQQLKHGARPLLEKGEVPQEPHQSANVILVGPIPKKEAQHVITVHWLMMMLIEYKLINKRCYLVTVTPRRVEGNKVEFEEFEPAWVANSDEEGTRGSTGEVGYLRHGQLQGQPAKDGKVNHYTHNKPEVETSRSSNCCGIDLKPTSPMQHGTVVVECGSTLCHFEIKVYEVDANAYARKAKQHQAPASPQPPAPTSSQDTNQDDAQRNLQVRNDPLHGNDPLEVQAEIPPQLHPRNISVTCTTAETLV